MTGQLPVIGLSAYAVRAAWGVWDTDVVLLPRNYVDVVLAAGGLPVLLPPLPGVIEQLVPRLEGLLLAGGPDVDPQRYGEQPGPATQVPSRERDDAELQLLAGAVDAGLPVLGICRGMQLLNVARGGTLVQHLPDVLASDVLASDVPASDVPASDVPASDVSASDVSASDVPASDVPASDVPASDVPDLDVPDHDVPDHDVPDLDVPDHDLPDLDVPDLDVPDHDLPDHDLHAPAPGVYGLHPVTVAAGTRLADLLGRTQVGGVPTYHHQGIARLGRGLVATAWAPDGTVEAVEDPGLPFCVAVQWHPEAGDDPRLIEGLVEAARRTRSVRRAATVAGLRA